MVALFHDIGAYKTEEIDEMISFETDNIWKHSVYGYLFLKKLSPLTQYAEILLYHHVHCADFSYYKTDMQPMAELLFLSDRVDIYLRSRKDLNHLEQYLKKQTGTLFSKRAVDLFLSVSEQIVNQIDQITFEDVVSHPYFTDEEVDQYLKMLTFAIDFRSEHTVTHTITTTQISYETAKIMGVREPELTKVFYGAMLHDLGKIAIPVEILEFPGKLSPQAMAIMKTHVELTAVILDHDVDAETIAMAIRHHERLDGSGYPNALLAKELTLSERIIAVSDVVSALLGTRSYKESFSTEKSLQIISTQAKQGKLDQHVVDAIVNHIDDILDVVYRKCEHILKTYQGINQEYRELLQYFEEKEASFRV